MDLKPHAKLTTTLRTLLKITIGVTSVAVLTGFYYYYYYSTLPSYIDANETILLSDAVTCIVGQVQFFLAIATGITFLRWIYISNKNLWVLSGESMRFTPGWSVGWFFIPIANLYKPYQVMKEIWRVSHKSNVTDHAVVGWWWALWLISTYLGQFAFKLTMRAEVAGDYAASAMTYIISDGIYVILSVVALAMVTRIGAAYSRNNLEPTGATYRGSAAVSPPPLT